MHHKSTDHDQNALGTFLQRVMHDDQIVETTLDEYDHCLDVLPPRWMSGSIFAFAEGATPFRLFWRIGRRYFSRQLSDPETHTFCRVSGASFIE
jgi:hypothetical protein